MHRRSAGIVVVGMFVMGVGSTRPAFAQAAPPPKPPAHEESAEFAFVGTSGNTSTKSVGLGGEVVLRPTDWVYRAKASYVQNEAAGVVSARTVTAAFRAAREWKSRTSLFAQTSYLRDRFSGVSSRATVEAGVAHTWERGRQSLGADASAGYANEQRENPPTVVGPPPPTVSTALVGVGQRYKLKLSPTSDFTDDVRYTKSLQTGIGYRVDHVAALTAKLTSRLSLKLSNTLRFVSAPVPGFKKTDTTTSMALVAKF
jgi:putative salt-induced outer membrane protein